jgi:SulP family sulfate permease
MTDVAAMLVRWRRTMTPFLGWIGELKDPQILTADLIAGITVALVLVPQSMDCAQLAGLPPYVGL